MMRNDVIDAHVTKSAGFFFKVIHNVINADVCNQSNERKETVTLTWQSSSGWGTRRVGCQTIVIVIIIIINFSDHHAWLCDERWGQDDWKPLLLYKVKEWQKSEMIPNGQSMSGREYIIHILCLVHLFQALMQPWSSTFWRTKFAQMCINYRMGYKARVHNFYTGVNSLLRLHKQYTGYINYVQDYINYTEWQQNYTLGYINYT